MGTFVDLSNERFGRLTIISCVARATRKTDGDTKWLCRCDCGKEKIVTRGNLKNGSTQSCGCIRNTQGGHTNKHPLWKRWDQMIDRCNNPNSKDFVRYGARGIRVCDRWLSFPLFLEDVGPTYRKRKTLDRKDVNGNYDPSNFRWASPKEQGRNRRYNRIIDTKWGRITIAEAAEKGGIQPSRLYKRIFLGWPKEQWFIPKTNKWARKSTS